MYFFLVNPASRSGQGLKDWERIKAVLEEKRIPFEVRFSAGAGDMARFAQELTEARDGQTHLVVLGGDGAVNEALQGIRNPDLIRFSNIPTGSGNDLARDVGISRNPVRALRHLLQSPERIPMDVGVLHYNSAFLPEGKGFRKITAPDRLFLVSSGIGFDAAVCQQAMVSPVKNILNRLKLGSLTYLGIALRQLIRSQNTRAGMLLQEEDGTVRKLPAGRMMFTAFMSHCYEGGGFWFCPRSDPSDGMLDLCAVGDVPVWKVLLVLPTAFFGRHYHYKGVERYKARKIRLRASRPLWVHTDGEVSAMSDDITVSCRHRFLAFYY